jgi:hypothetical protein
MIASCRSMNSLLLNEFPRQRRRKAPRARIVPNDGYPSRAVKQHSQMSPPQKHAPLMLGNYKTTPSLHHHARLLSSLD